MFTRAQHGITFHRKLVSYGEEFLAPCTTQLEDHPLSAVRDCLFNIFTAILHIWRLSLPSATNLQLHWVS
jgi:hypothetical protein